MAELLCYRCGATLTRQDVCLQCGEDMRLYKRIFYNADQLFNLGLERAKARDLSGARNYLRECLQLNKQHIQARNLLGLVYYELGEPALALKEWVISTSYQPEDNLAQRYLKNTEKSMHSINGSVTRYNMAVNYIQNKNIDLAEIQLKQVVGRSYRVLKAMQLMALIYIKNEHFSKAQKLLKEAFKIDRGNPVTRRYFSLLEEQKKASRSSSYRDAMSRAVAESHDKDVIIPKTTREYGSYFMYVLYILIGVILGAGLVYFIVSPTIRTKEQEQNRDNLISYEKALSDWQNEVVKKNGEIEELTASIGKLKDQIGELENRDEGLDYSPFLAVLEAYTDNNPQEIEEAFSNLAFDTNVDEYMRVYNMIKAYILSDLGNVAYFLGLQNVYAAKYEKALEMFKYSVEKEGYNSQNVYYLGVVYQLMNQNDWAVFYYQYGIVTFPDGDYYNNSVTSLASLLEDKPELTVPDLKPGELGPGKVDKEYVIKDKKHDNELNIEEIPEPKEDEE